MIIRNHKHLGLKAVAAALMASTCLAPLTASAHTDSLGFLIAPGASEGLYNAEIFYGSWHDGGVGAEGQLLLTLQDGSPTGTPVAAATFAIVSGYDDVSDGVLPPGLVAGVNYFFPNSMTPEVDLTGDPDGHEIYSFQSALFIGLAAGVYTFGYSAGSSLSVNWQPSDPAINAGRFTIRADGSLVVDGAPPTITDIDDANGPYTIEQLIDGDVNPVFDGGVLVADADAAVSLNLTLKAAGGGIDTDGHDVTISGVISDAAGASGGLTKTGEGVLTLTGANTYTGGTVVEAGVLRGDAVSLQGDITNNATVEFAQEGEGTYTGVISGLGDLVKSGEGALTLTAVQTYTGQTIVSEGVLALSGEASIAASSGLMVDGVFDISDVDADAAIKALTGSGQVVLGGASLVLTDAAGAFSGQIQGAGGLKIQSGSQTLSGVSAYTGETTIAADGALTLQGGSALADTGHVTLGGRLTIASSETIGGVSGNGVLDLQSGTLTLAGQHDDVLRGVISGEGQIIKTGAGTLRLAGDNTFIGGLTVNAGVLEISSDANLGAGALTLGAAKLKIWADVRSDNALVVTSQNSVIDTNGRSVVLSGDISGAGALVKQGAGTLTLTGQNSQDGIRLLGGTLEFNSDAALGAADGVLSIADNTRLRTLASFTIEHELHVDNTLQAEFDTAGHDIVMAGNISGAGSVKKIGAGTLTLTGQNTQVVIDVLGGKVIAASQESIGGAGGTIYLRTNGGFTAGSNMTVTQAVQVTGDNATFDTGANDVTLAGVLSGDACFNKVGTGSLNLTSVSSNEIGACVQEGTLRFNNVFTGDVWVGADGVASGAGRINGDVEVRGRLSPGNSPGQMTVNGSLTQLNGSVFDVEIDGPTAGSGAGHYDTLVLTGAGSVYTADGSINPILRGISGSANNTYTPQIGDTFQVVTAQGGVVGSYDTLVQPTAGLAANTRLDVRYRANAVILAVTPTGFAEFAGAGNGAAFGGAVDALRPAAGVRDETAAGRLVDGLIGLNGAQLNRVLQQGAGEIYADAANAVLQTNRTARGAITERLTGSFGGEGDSAHHAWGTITHDDGKAKADGAAQRYSVDANAIVLGYDGAVGANLTVGGAFAYNATRVRNDLAAKADVESYVGMAYGAWRSGPLYVNGLVGYGVDQYKVERSVGVSTGAEALWSKPDGRSWAADVEIGRSYQAGGLTLTPAVGLGYDSLSLDGFTETGADTVALTFGDEDRTAWTARAGARLSTTWSSGERSVSPYASVFLTRELSDRQTTFDPSLQGEAFQVRSPSVDRTGVRLGAGVTAQASARVQLQAGYRYDDADGASRQSVTGGAMVRW